MKILPAPSAVQAPPATREKTMRLRDLKPGDVFRFPESISYESALKANVEEEGFFIVINLTPQETGRVSVITADFKQVLKRDGDRTVIIHEAELLIAESEQVAVE